MLTTKEIELIKKIHDKTLSNELKWEERSLGIGYEVSFPTSSLVIFQFDNPDTDTVDIVLQIYNSSGQLGKEISDNDLREHIKNSYTYMFEIFQQARYIALKVDGTIDNLLDALEA